MTREELMANRILPKEAVDDITWAYQQEHYPSYEEIRDSDEEIDTASRTYISPEKVQRMPPEEVVDYLVECDGHYDVRSCDGILHLLSVATGRTEDDLRQAIFGTGTFDAKKFYQPTELQKRTIKFLFKIAPKLAELNIPFDDYKKWTKEMQDEWSDITSQVPDEAVNEVFGEVNEYIGYYLKNGMPLWLY